MSWHSSLQAGRWSLHQNGSRGYSRPIIVIVGTFLPHHLDILSGVPPNGMQSNIQPPWTVVGSVPYGSTLAKKTEIQFKCLLVSFPSSWIVNNNQMGISTECIFSTLSGQNVVACHHSVKKKANVCFGPVVLKTKQNKKQTSLQKIRVTR